MSNREITLRGPGTLTMLVIQSGPHSFRGALAAATAHAPAMKMTPLGGWSLLSPWRAIGYCIAEQE